MGPRAIVATNLTGLAFAGVVASALAGGVTSSSPTKHTAATARNGTPHIGGCQVFPRSNALNRDISHAKVDPRSARWIRSISEGGRFLHPDFGSNPDYGIPITIAKKSQKRVPIHFTAYGDESDKGPYPIPANARVEGSSDAHVLVVQRSRCKLYELFGARRGPGQQLARGQRRRLQPAQQPPAPRLVDLR